MTTRALFKLPSLREAYRIGGISRGWAARDKLLDMMGSWVNQRERRAGPPALPAAQEAEEERRAGAVRASSAAATMFQGPEADSAKPSSRVLKPPGGGSSNLFGSTEEVCSSNRPHRMASNIFGASEEPQNIPKRTNPPGGKESGIFEDSSSAQPRPRMNPPGGKTSDIFGSPVSTSVVRAHPNKPKDHIVLKEDETPKKLEATENIKPQLEDGGEKKDLGKEERCKDPEPKIDNHEPRLGPRPRSHNKVLNPPGGKSSIAFY